MRATKKKYAAYLRLARQAEGIFKKVCIAGLGRLGASLLDQNLFDNSVFEKAAISISNEKSLVLEV